jgi:hypothetical protein
VLLCLTKKAYRKTLLSTKTANKFIREYFTNNEDDETKFEKFKTYKYKWQRAICPEVKAWLNANIHTWLEEQPDWFNEHAMLIIPEDYIDNSQTLACIRTCSAQAMIQERRGSFMGGALMPPGLTPKREDEVDEEVGKLDTDDAEGGFNT